MSIVTIRVEPLKAVASFVSKEETRYYLNGVFFDKAGLLVATDGHRLAAIKPLELTGEFNDMILPSETIKKILQVKPSNKRMPLYVSFDSESNIATVHHAESAGLAAFPFKPIEGTFPDWRRVVPASENFNDSFKKGKTGNSGAGFNSVYLASFQAANAVACRDTGDNQLAAAIDAKMLARFNNK